MGDGFQGTGGIEGRNELMGTLRHPVFILLLLLLVIVAPEMLELGKLSKMFIKVTFSQKRLRFGFGLLLYRAPGVHLQCLFLGKVCIPK